jgi:hypothetical protein
VGTLVECITLFTVLSRIEDASEALTVKSFGFVRLWAQQSRIGDFGRVQSEILLE